MITVIAARGCYAHHLVNMLAVATDATSVENFFELSPYGDSHSIRDSQEINSKFNVFHVKFLQHTPVPGEQFIIIQPDRNHVLDYVDNSFSKDSDYNLKEWIQERWINREEIPKHYFSEILNFLDKNNVYTGDSKLLVPENQPWIIREFLSFKIDQIMFSCYERYFMLTYHSKIKTTDFFDNFQLSFVELVNSLGLKITMSMDKIISHNNQFVKKQKFNNIQILCIQYVEAAIAGQHMNNPCISIFDEAYVQSQLRHRGWEIRVDNLNVLPDAAELHTMLYPAHLKDQ